jgi:hypothetical protein
VALISSLDPLRAVSIDLNRCTFENKQRVAARPLSEGRNNDAVCKVG